MDSSKSVQALIHNLQSYWAKHGCAILQPIDMPVGAGTFHPATFLRAIGPEPWSVAYVQGCRRPTDGRYGNNPNRLQHYYQFQVLLKPSPENIQQCYLDSLQAQGINLKEHDLRFVEDNWKSPTLGAHGLGWEVWLDGMEITQFTYFQQVGGMDCKPISGEITYGIERIAMYLQNIENVFDLVWSQDKNQTLYYGDLFQESEKQSSHYNFEEASIPALSEQFASSEQQCLSLCEKDLAIPAYEQVLHASHCFNLLDARKALSVNERQAHILRIRALATQVAQSWYNSREAKGFPLCPKSQSS